MFRWFLVDGVATLIDEIELTESGTADEAKEEAKIYWDRLSAYDQKRRECFYIMQTDTDEDGIPNQENALEIIDLLDLFRA